MVTLDDVRKRIEDIKNSDFDVEEINCYRENHKRSKLLRKALLCSNAIKFIESIPADEKKALDNELDEIMKNKIRDLNPNFSEETINNIIFSYKWNYIIYPMDIFVIDDVVFQKRATLTEFGDIHKIETFIPDSQKPYNIQSEYFVYYMDPLFKVKPLTKEERKSTQQFISNSINSLYGQNITEVNEHQSFINVIRGINIYINMKLDDIGISIENKEEIYIKMCIQNKEDMVLYYIHQSFIGNQPIWILSGENDKVWRLTEETLKVQNKIYYRKENNF